MSRLEDVEEGWMARALNKPAKSLAEGMSLGPDDFGGSDYSLPPVPLTNASNNGTVGLPMTTAPTESIARTLIHQTVLWKKKSDHMMVLRVVRCNKGDEHQTLTGYEVYIATTRTNSDLVMPRTFRFMASGTSAEVSSCHDGKINQEVTQGWYVETGGRIDNRYHAFWNAKELFWTPPEMWSNQPKPELLTFPVESSALNFLVRVKVYEDDHSVIRTADGAYFVWSEASRCYLAAEPQAFGPPTIKYHMVPPGTPIPPEPFTPPVPKPAHLPLNTGRRITFEDGE